MEKKSIPKRIGLRLLQWLARLLMMAAIFTLFSIGIEGCPLFFNAPEAEEIHHVTVVQASTGESLEIAAPGQDLEIAANLLGIMRYVPFSQGQGEPAYTLTYFLNDGSRVAVGVNEASVFYQGHSHKLKGESLVWNILDGYYF